MRASSTTKLFLGIVLAAGSLVACSRGGGEARTALTSAQLTPQNTGPSSHTVDNTGFIDNGGRSSDMTYRSEASGMRATEAGSDRPTGTPGVGLPMPLDPKVPAGVRESSGVTPAPAMPERDGDAIGRMTSARCEHETTCKRVGAGRTYGSPEVCVASERERVQRHVDGLGCERGIDSVHLAICLGALRGQTCDGASRVDALPQCRKTALCAP